ncbi:phosphodiester glycosidase family protein [Anaerotignum lactatifermentans]|uniref:phosphodiester glycosidase family protein n=1 Tax=Anaerotignum lactatifermentans TaxID=160404 RepID=UPI0026732CA0|nr:phosphodiester glycosidase family protein [Anaerotignum lactatifermentans]
MKKRFYGIKRLLAAFVAATLTFTAAGVTTVFAAQTVYENKTQETITRGVTYEKNSRMTTDGIQDIYVLTIDLTESTLELKEVESKTEYGLKETVQKMLTDNGAIAGVNSDFFGMAGTYSAGFGPVVRDGELVSAGTSINQDKNQYGTYVKDKNGNSIFTYFKTTVKFSNSAKTIDLASINKVTSMVFPILFNREAATSTADLDKRFDNLVKFVVQNNTITYISQKGETVEVPENGYLIVMSGDYYTNAASVFKVGDPVTLQVSSTIDFDQIDTAFGGGGLLLLDGQEAPATDIVAAGRQPRTAFGVSQDGTKAIMMVVDGRGDSIGATHSEMAALMKEYGAYEALHLDGGGSSTMVVQTVDDAAPQLQNTPSDGAQRKVIASVGVFQTAPKGEIKEIGITTVNQHTQPGKTAEFTVYGLDEYKNRIYIAPEDVTFDVVGVEGTWDGYLFQPTTTGEYSVVATYGDGLTAVANATCYPTARLKATYPDVSIKNVGGTTNIYVTAYDTEGFGRAVTNDVTYTVANPAIGTMNGNTFTAKAKGSTYVKCSWAGQDTYVTITVGGASKVTAPASTSAADPLQQTVTKQNDGAFYLNITGELKYTGTGKVDVTTYNAQRSRVRSAADSGADVTVYGGPCDITTPTVQDSLTWNGSYRFMNRDGASVVLLAASQGIRKTDPSQYGRFTQDIAAAGNDTIIFVTDKTPSDYPSAAEADYFRAILNKYVEEGKTVFVVSCSGNAYWASTKDGVRYINLPDLWRADGTANSNVYMLKFRIADDGVTYQPVKV